MQSTHENKHLGYKVFQKYRTDAFTFFKIKFENKLVDSCTYVAEMIVGGELVSEESIYTTINWKFTYTLI